MDLNLVPCKKDTYHTINTPVFDTKRNNKYTSNSPTKPNPSLPHHAIQSIQKPPRKPPPEQIVPMVPLAIYPPPGCHPSDSAILGSHLGDTSPKSTVNVRTNSLVSRGNATTPQQPRGRSAGPSKSSTYETPTFDIAFGVPGIK